MAAGISVKLSLNDSLFQAGIRRAGAAVASFGKTAAKVGFATLAAAVAGGAAAMIAGAKHVINLGDHLVRMKRITGLSVSSLFILGEAFDQAGNSAENVAPVIGKMEKNLRVASKSGEKFKTSMKGIGINSKELMAMSPQDQFLTLGRAIDGLPDGKKQAVAMERFGKAGLSLLPVFAELKNFDPSGLQKQADAIDKNAEAFKEANDAIRRAKTNAQGLFVGLAGKVAPMIANLGKRLEAVDFVAWGDRIADSLMHATQMGLALWNDPAGVMGYFWASAQAYVLEFGNWLVDAVDGAFPGIGAALVDAITQTRGWGEILVGYAIKFGTVLKDSIMFVVNKVADLAAMLPKGALNPVSALTLGSGNAVAKDAFSQFRSRLGDAANAPANTANRDIGQELIDRGNQRLAKNADDAAHGLATFTRGTDHFGAVAARQAADLARATIAPALTKAAEQMTSVGLSIGDPAHKQGAEWTNWRKASGTLRGASMAGTLSGAFGSTKFSGSSLMGASLLGGPSAPPGGIAPDDWAKMNGKQRNTFMDAAVARGDMVRPNGMIRAGDKKRREAYEKTKLMERIGVDKTNDILEQINQKIGDME